MTSAEVLLDGFSRVRESVPEVVAGLSPAQLAARLDAAANPVSWLVWHLTRVQDDHVAGAFGGQQVWTAGGWAERLGLAPEMMEVGYGHTSAQVAATAEAICGTPAPGELLAEYHEAVYAQTASLVTPVTDKDLERVVDRRWTPPVTLGVRLVSVIDDDARHIGQAEFVRGIVLRALPCRVTACPPLARGPGRPRPARWAAATRARPGPGRRRTAAGWPPG